MTYIVSSPVQIAVLEIVTNQQHQLPVVLMQWFSDKQFHDVKREQWTECKNEFRKCLKMQDEGPTYVAKCKTSEKEVRQKLKVCLIQFDNY